MTDHPDPQDSDEALSALIDGELDDASALALHERMAANPALAARFAALQAANARFAAELRALDDVPMPPGVLALLAERDEPVRAGNVVSLQRRPAAVQRLQLPLALAASIALVVGFLAAHLIGPLTTGPAEGPPAWLADGTIAASSPLFDVLENQPSGSVTELAGGAATPIMSFARSGGGFCRELQVRSAAGSSSDPGSADRRRTRRQSVSRVTSSMPSVTRSPTAQATPATTPPRGALMACSIFMASITASTWPAATRSPGCAATEITWPGMGETMRSPPAAASASVATSARAMTTRSLSPPRMM
jgi:hypothetical protein